MVRGFCGISCRWSEFRPIVLAFSLLLLLGVEAVGQGLIVNGSTDHPAAAAVAEIVARDRYRLLDRDTVLPAFFRHDGDLVVVDAVVRLEGSITGSVAVVGGSIFLRPGARIGGTAVSVAGIIGMSTLATVGDTLSLPPEYHVEVTRASGEYALNIQNPPRPPFLAPSGLFGVVLPAYDRVNGATVRLGVVGNLAADSLRPHYRLTGEYYSARGSVGGRGEIRVPLGGRAYLGVAGGRQSLTPDAWIRDDVSNSLSALFVRSDVRNYYESDYGEIAIEQLPPATLRPGEGYVVPHVRVRASRDQSLRRSNPWTLFGDDEWRPNPTIFEGTLTSATFGVATGWRGITSGLVATADLEWAFPSPTGFSWGDREFVQVIGDGSWGMRALWNHSLTLRAHVMHSFGPDPAPEQRWTLLGGPGTLPTLDQGSLRGDNVVFLQSTYGIPLSGLTVPLLGIPEIVARHAVGTAWISAEPTPRWQQNLGVGLRVRMMDAFVYVNPADSTPDPHFSVGFHLPN